MKAGLRALRLLSCVSLALLAFAASSGPASATTTYTITDLGTLGGDYSRAGGISPSGQVVGASRTTPGGDEYAFVWEDGVMDNLGTLGGVPSVATKINASGQVVGLSGTPVSGERRAFLWLPAPAYGLSAGMHDLGALGGSWSWADDINGSGQIVGGSYTTETGDRHAFLWEDGVLEDLGTFGGSYAEANGINDLGQVVGQAYVDDHYHAILWEDGDIEDLGTLGGSAAAAADINNSSQVVGSASTAGGASHAFLWLPAPAYGMSAGMHDLGVLSAHQSSACAINARGQVVGTNTATSPYGGEPIIRPFLWEDGAMVDLNDLIAPGSGWLLTNVTDINDLGQIVGTGSYGGQGHAFLLTPVPEPSLLGLLAFGAVGVLLRKRRKS